MSKEEQKIIIYEEPDRKTAIEVNLFEDTVWLTQAQLAELFNTSSQNITMHLKNVFEEDELEENATCKDFLQVRKEGKRTVKRKQKHYNLDAIKQIAIWRNAHNAGKLFGNKKLFRADGTRIIGNNALVAITIMIAESDPQEKDTMTKLVVNLISASTV